jgi:hypothetical protein
VILRSERNLCANVDQHLCLHLCLHLCCVAEFRHIWIKAAPAAPPKPWEARPGARRATPARLADLTGSYGHVPRDQCIASFLAPDCPSRGHRVNGGPAGPSHAIGYADIDPATTHKGQAAMRKMAAKKDQPRPHTGSRCRSALSRGFCARALLHRASAT